MDMSLGLVAVSLLGNCTLKLSFLTLFLKWVSANSPWSPCTLSLIWVFRETLVILIGKNLHPAFPSRWLSIGCECTKILTILMLAVILMICQRQTTLTDIWRLTLTPI